MYTPPMFKPDRATSLAFAKARGFGTVCAPDWHVSPDQVPTWLYQGVHLTGTVRRLSDSELGPHAMALARQPEAAAQVMADEMRSLRPQLFATQSTQLNAAFQPEGTM